MRRHLNHLPLRIRLTLAFAVAAAVLLGGIGGFIFLSVKSGLDDELDHSLRLRAGELAERARKPVRVSCEPALTPRANPPS